MSQVGEQARKVVEEVDALGLQQLKRIAYYSLSLAVADPEGPFGSVILAIARGTLKLPPKPKEETHV